jgi:glycosyltransferase involved in cell wall biosynthesis
MKISVVVPAFNEERLLAASLRRLKESVSVFVRRG